MLGRDVLIENFGMLGGGGGDERKPHLEGVAGSPQGRQTLGPG